MASGRAVNNSELFKLKQLRDELGRFIKRVDQKPTEILVEEAARIKAEAKMEVPVESGDLRNSINVSVTGSASRKTLNATASSVHRDYDYAGKQHDDTSLNHPNGGKAHYISDPFERGVQRITKRLEDELSFDR